MMPIDSGTRLHQVRNDIVCGVGGDSGRRTRESFKFAEELEHLIMITRDDIYDIS